MADESPWIHTAASQPLSDDALAAAAAETPASADAVDAWTTHLQRAIDRRLGPHYLPTVGGGGGLENALLTDDRIFCTVQTGVWTALESVTKLSDTRLRVCRSAHEEMVHSGIDDAHDSIRRKFRRRLRAGDAPLVIGRDAHHSHVTTLREDGLQKEEACKAASFCENLRDDEIGLILKTDTPSTQSVGWGINDTNYRIIFQNKVSDSLQRRFALIKKNRQRYASRLGLSHPDDGSSTE